MIPLSTQATVMPILTCALSLVFKVFEILSRDMAYMVTLRETAIRPVYLMATDSEKDIQSNGLVRNSRRKDLWW